MYNNTSTENPRMFWVNICTKLLTNANILSQQYTCILTVSSTRSWDKYYWLWCWGSVSSVLHTIPEILLIRRVVNVFCISIFLCSCGMTDKSSQKLLKVHHDYVISLFLTKFIPHECRKIDTNSNLM